MTLLRAGLFLLALAMGQAAYAHEVRPAYLQLQQTSATDYEVLWKVPGRGEDLRLGLYVEFPASCDFVSEPRAVMVNGAFSQRSTISCERGLDAGVVSISGLAATMTDVLVRLERSDGSTFVTRVSPSQPFFTVTKTEGLLAVAGTYMVLGIEHILGGFDHLLFVLALLLIVGQRRSVLIRTITAFTVAHSITLALATLGLVRLPSAPVEAMIALSIVFVASEILHGQAGRPGLTARSPWLVAFVFGLLHGFGFAGALQETGLPEQAVPVALLLFNVGVEIGQLCFVAGAALLWRLVSGAGVRFPAGSEAIPAYAIGAWASYWTIERTLCFLIA